MNSFQHELANMASSSEGVGSLSDATMMTFLQSMRFEATSFTEDLSNLADLIYSEMQQFQQDKENLEKFAKLDLIGQSLRICLRCEGLPAC